MADDDTTNELPTDQDIDDTPKDASSEGDQSLEARAGDDALVDEGIIENKPSSEDPPETHLSQSQGS